MWFFFCKLVQLQVISSSEQKALALNLIWRDDLVHKGPKMAPGVNDVILPIVCPGVERDVPSGEG